MTDKERLEEIKRKFDLDRIRKFLDTNLISPQDLIYLIQQAERAQEYDRELISLEDNKHYVSEMLAKNKRYREAIKKGINATRYTNPEVAYILSEALEGRK